MDIHNDIANPQHLSSSVTYELHHILDILQIPYILFDSNKNIQHMNLAELFSERSIIEHKQLLDFVHSVFKKKKQAFTKISTKDKIDYQLKGTPFKKDNILSAVVVTFQELSPNLEEYKNMEIDLKTIFETNYDVLFVADENGKAIRVSAACEQFWGKKQSDLLGKNTDELEREGVFNPSVTRLVFEQKRKISVIQKTCKGKTLLVVGTPVMNKKGKILRVINASRDVTEIHTLQEDLAETHDLLEYYQNEIQLLKKEKQINNSTRLVYQSEKMKQIIEQAKIIAQYDTPVLITGESGVGKEGIATLIHERSHRSNQAFIKVNCGAIPSSLLESELFGYEKGTFTGANQKGKQGLFSAANNGTILLDEITEMPIQLQVKLLRVLQEKEIMPVGSVTPRKINVRVISTTNQNIDHLISNGLFRKDLYYRLNGIPIEVPSLNERKADIIALVHHFSQKFNHYYDNNKFFSEKAIIELKNFTWKGNIRELKNFVERLLILSPDEKINEDLVKSFLGKMEETPPNFHFEISQDVDLYSTLKDVEKQILQHAVQKYKTTVDIAHSLNISQSTVSKKLKGYGINLSKM